MKEEIITINDLPKEAQEELKEILERDILDSYHSGKLGKELGEEVEEGLNDSEVLRLYNNETCWNHQIIEEYIMRWRTENKQN